MVIYVNLITNEEINKNLIQDIPNTYLQSLYEPRKFVVYKIKA